MRFGNVALLVFSLCITFIAIEISLAVLDIGALRQESPYRSADGTLHHVLVPNSEGISKTSEWNVAYSINSIGLRDREFGEKKGTRILMLGDSFTEGYGVEADKSFVKRFEAKLNTTGDYEVINLGVSSYSPLLAYLELKEKGLALQPDLVILSYDFGDVHDDYEYSLLAKWSGDELIAVKPRPEPPKTFFASARVLLSRHSRVYQLFAQRFSRATSPITPYDLESDKLMFTRNNSDADYLRLFNHSAPYLLKIKALLDANNASFIIHIYPYGHQASAEAWSGRSAFFLEKKVYPYTPFELVESFGEQHSIPVINSYPYLAEGDARQRYYDYDGHFTEQGHEAASEALYDFFTR